MSAQPEPQSLASTVASSRATRRWLLFVHQLPASPSNLRVRTWRRLQQLGAIPVKQAVYALPDTAAAREDFEWLATEVKGAGGEATVFAAHHVDAWSDDALVEEFRRTRQESYSALTAEIEGVLKRAGARRRARGTRAPALARLAEGFRHRLSALEQIDFFGSAGGDRVRALLTELEERTQASARGAVTPAPAGEIDATSYQRRLWVTRPRPGVDRMASAWLIRRFIDPHARFSFAADRDTLPTPDAVPFDMFGVAFGHHGEACTFETLCAVFRIADPAVSRLAAIVHDLDLKDGRFGASDAPTVGSLIDGLQLAHGDDAALLEQGITLFDAMYRAFAHAMRAPGPRPLAKRATGAAARLRRRP